MRRVYENFAGVNNRDSASELATDIKGCELAAGYDVDIDRRGKISRRKVPIKKLSGRYRSVWSNRAESVTLAVRDGTLVRIIAGATYTEKVLMSGIQNEQMEYEEVGEKIYFSNEGNIGYYLDGKTYDLPEPAESQKAALGEGERLTGNLQFKLRMPPGYLMCFHYSRLWIVAEIRGDLHYLCYSDAAAHMRLDERYDPFVFSKRLTLLESIEGGLVVSEPKRIIYMQGKSPAKMTAHKLASYGAIPGTAWKEQNITVKGQQHNEALFMRTEEGVCMATGNGTFVNLTQETYKPSAVKRGAGLVRKGNSSHFITTTY